MIRSIHPDENVHDPSAAPHVKLDLLRIRCMNLRQRVLTISALSNPSSRLALRAVEGYLRQRQIAFKEEPDFFTDTSVPGEMLYLEYIAPQKRLLLAVSSRPETSRSELAAGSLLTLRSQLEVNRASIYELEYQRGRAQPTLVSFRFDLIDIVLSC